MDYQKNSEGINNACNIGEDEVLLVGDELQDLVNLNDDEISFLEDELSNFINPLIAFKALINDGLIIGTGILSKYHFLVENLSSHLPDSYAFLNIESIPENLPLSQKGVFNISECTFYDSKSNEVSQGSLKCVIYHTRKSFSEPNLLSFLVSDKSSQMRFREAINNKNPDSFNAFYESYSNNSVLSFDSELLDDYNFLSKKGCEVFSLFNLKFFFYGNIAAG